MKIQFHIVSLVSLFIIFFEAVCNNILLIPKVGEQKIRTGRKGNGGSCSLFAEKFASYKYTGKAIHSLLLLLYQKAVYDDIVAG